MEQINQMILARGKKYMVALTAIYVIFDLYVKGLQFSADTINLMSFVRTLILIVLLYSLWTGGKVALWILRAGVLLGAAYIFLRGGVSDTWFVISMVVPLTILSWLLFSAPLVAYVDFKAQDK